MTKLPPIPARSYAVCCVSAGSYLRINYRLKHPSQMLTNNPREAHIFPIYETARDEAVRYSGVAVRHPLAVEQPELF